VILKQVGVAGEIILRQTVLDGIVQCTKIALLQKDHYWVSIYYYVIYRIGGPYREGELFLYTDRGKYFSIRTDHLSLITGLEFP
jgi:hypothetical protein